MIVKPIEFGIIQQMNNVSNTSQTENSRPMNEQLNLMQQEQKNEEIKSTQVQKKDSADNNNKNYDARNKSENQYSKGKSEKDKEKKKKINGTVTVKGVHNGSFDIKI